MALSPQIVQAIARDGVKGDTLLGHLTRGDTVIPSQAPPAVHDIARQSMAAHGMDVNRFVAGAPGNHINPKTGLHSFEDGGGGGEGGGGEGGGGGGEGGEGGEGGGGGGSGPSGGGDKSSGDQGSGGGAQGGNPGDPGDTGNGGTAGGNGVSGGANGMGVGGGNASGGANSGSGQGVAGADGAPSGAPGDDGFSASGVDTSAQPGLTASQALLGVDFSDLGPAGKLAMGVVPGMGTLAGLNAATAHGVDDPSNPGGNVSSASIGGVGMGQGAPSSAGGADRGGVGGSGPGGNGGGGAGGASDHPDTVQNVLNNQTVGGSNGGTAAPDAPSNPAKQQNPVTPTDPFTDLKAALAAAHGIDKSPTFTSGSDAEILNAILGPQRAAAEQQLQNAHMRGTLSDQGYNSAELGLGTQDQQANSRIGNISDNLLAAYQQKLDAYANQAITSAGGTQQGSPWDVTPWQTGYNSLLSTLQGREQGDLLNLLPSGGSLYDIPTLLANAGNSQGLYNPGGSPIQQALSDQRGLGTTGVF